MMASSPKKAAAAVTSAPPEAVAEPTSEIQQSVRAAVELSLIHI